ncbi:uncharacterized protein BDZ83DRAFT_237445 [Colletotrichum acutatum]|uniref:Secreted protein n=1 Tax=Glomerella acutata TaxID=27357 RepID=A0AAD8XHS3_GLOAC|nr:uncharacterized protein BDZ83DRAFT_237445 [Colletotrichum acutatum]KAK1726826.1 hypothetical protein BDZ83DRAFT_237445 [Colletotrichum acutatum]
MGLLLSVLLSLPCLHASFRCMYKWLHAPASLASKSCRPVCPPPRFPDSTPTVMQVWISFEVPRCLLTLVRERFFYKASPQWGLPVSITNCKFLKPQTGAKDHGPIGKAWTLDFTFAGCSSMMLTLRLRRKSSINVKRALSCQESHSLSEVSNETITTRGSKRGCS